MGKRHTIIVRVPITITVDATAWAQTNGLTSPDNPRSYNIRDVRADIRTYVTHQVMGMPMIEDTGAVINGVHPDRPTQQPATMLKMPTGNYYQAGVTMEIHQRWTGVLSSLAPRLTNPGHDDTAELPTIATVDGHVYHMTGTINNDQVIVYTQRQGTCACGKPATEVIDLEVIHAPTRDLIPNRCTIMLCADCNLAQWEQD